MSSASYSRSPVVAGLIHYDTAPLGTGNRTNDTRIVIYGVRFKNG